MPQLSKKIINYLNFNRTEQRGLVVLFILLVMVIAANILMPVLLKKSQTDLSQFEAEINLFHEKQQAAKDSLMRLSDELANREAADNASHIKPFRFNPNQLPREKWKQLGFTEQQIDVIKNYEDKGGQFRSKKDVAKIYSISKAEYSVLEPFIVIPKPAAVEEIEVGLTPVPFDPNKATPAEFEAIGLSDRLIKNIINYRNKGGFFDDAEDFSKLYALSAEDFKVLEPYIEIHHELLPDQTTIEKPLLSIEINSADTLDLQQLTGIGPSFASRIVKYRDLLGGYSDKTQLLEVFGMDSLRYVSIADNILVDQKKIQKININSASVKELIVHPYIEFYLAKSIITYREQIGNYENINELLNAKLIYLELFQKIAPYLTLNEME